MKRHECATIYPRHFNKSDTHLKIFYKFVKEKCFLYFDEIISL